MNAMTVAALVSAWALGGLMVATLWPHERSFREDAGVILPLGLLVGLGATSVIFFALSLVSARPALLGGAMECVGILVLAWRKGLLFRRSGVLKTHDGERAARAPRSPGWKPFTALDWLLGGAFVQAVVVAVVLAWRAGAAEPWGGWDAWTIWNMHARLMLRAGTSWPELLGAAALNWTHPDYPRLLPATVARMWGWTGYEAPAAAALVSVAFAGATVALLVAVMVKLRGRIAALGGGLLLLCTPFFVTFAPNQHADIPLGSFMLAAVLLGAMTSLAERPNGWWALAGVSAGFAAWTKNEGLLFAFAFAAVGGGFSWRAGSPRTALSFFAALGVAIVPVLFFKLRLAPDNDLMSAPLGPRIGQLFEPARHATILAASWRDLRGFGEWRIGPWVAMALPLLAWRARTRLRRAEWLVPALLGLMLGGYYAVYLLTPQDLTWHLDTSLVRLLLQLWPLAILLWCLVLPAAPSPAESPSRWTRWTAKRSVFAGVNCLVAIGLVAGLARQRGENELAVRRIQNAEVSVMLGEGWFPLERHQRDEWSWSSGVANLRLHVNGQRAVGPVTVRFGLRSVGPRTVAVRRGSEVLWEGVVGAEFVPVAMAGLTLASGFTVLEFSTDAPGVAESPEHGGRSLAFALYNLRIE